MAVRDEVDDDRWILRKEMSKVVKLALSRYVPDLKDEEPNILVCKNKEFGDFQCNNHLSIWKQKRNTDEGFEKIHLISKAIKNNLPASAYDMMECNVLGVGFLCFKLSKIWMAKSIHKMLINGIDTWAPKLPIKKAIVDFSSRNIAEEMDLGHLSSTIIGDTLGRMLEYSKVDVIRRNRLGDRGTQVGILLEFLFETFPNGEVNDLAIGELVELYEESNKRFYEDAEFRKRAQQAVISFQDGDETYRNAYAQICEINRKGYEKVFKRLGVHVEEKNKSIYDPNILWILDILRKVGGLIEKSEGDEVIFVEEKEMMHHVITERKKEPLFVTKDGGCEYALTDLADLWYEIYEEKAEWVVYVADVHEEDHTELCIAAARRAGWLPTDENEYPRTKFVGYGHVQGDDLKRFHASSTQVVDLLNEVKTRCKAALLEQDKANVWAAQELELERIAEAFGYGALKYANLKELRLLNFTVNFDEMLNKKGNTGVYLLYTHAQICSIIRQSCENMEELKKKGELILEKDEERELGFHLLLLTEAVEDACTNGLPDILCEYLYKLSEKWTNFFSNCQVIGCRGRGQTSRLLLCEATEVVMRKCFHLLGITPIYNIQSLIL